MTEAKSATAAILDSLGRREEKTPAGYDFTKGVPATIPVSFTVPTLPGSPTFTHHLRRRVTGTEMSDFLERLTAGPVGVDDAAEKEARRHEAEAFVYAQLMTPDIDDCRIEGYGGADSMQPVSVVEFLTKGPEGANADTLLELRRHIGFAISGWLRLKTSDGSFR